MQTIRSQANFREPLINHEINWGKGGTGITGNDVFSCGDPKHIGVFQTKKLKHTFLWGSYLNQKQTSI